MGKSAILAWWPWPHPVRGPAGDPARALAAARAAGLAVAAVVGTLAAPTVRAAHGLAWGDAPKYPAGYTHFDYARPDAPRGGTVVLDGFGSFDKLNPFTLKGVAVMSVQLLMFETLCEASDDEPFSMYGLLAEDVAFAPDHRSITFRLHPQARFSNGDPVLADDVRYSFETLVSKQSHPRFRQYFADVKRVVVVDPRTVRFEFARRNHELHMIIGSQLPIFSRKWGLQPDGRRKPFDQIVQEPPIASGPYRIEQVDWGRTIRYRFDPGWWALKAGVPSRRGMFNFERVVYKYFKDETARLEGFKAGEFDWIHENSARNWARGYQGPQLAKGLIRKVEFPHRNAAGMQGFALNTRRALFRDVRVREALALAFDFEWMNRQIFYGQYARAPSYFTNSDMAAEGAPGPDELAVLEPLRAKLDPKVFGPVPALPGTDPPGSLRANLRRALALLGEAGWQIADDGMLRDRGGRPFAFEVLSYSKALERVAVPWARNLEKLGIRATLRVTDPTLFQKRIDDFEFDTTVHSYGASQTPGNELIERFTSAAAAEKGSDNVAGVRDPAVDAIVSRLLESDSRDELVARARALDRVLRHGWYLVPQYYAPSHRVAFRTVFGWPATLPLYYVPGPWMLKTWWRAAQGASDGGATTAPAHAPGTVGTVGTGSGPDASPPASAGPAAPRSPR